MWHMCALREMSDEMWDQHSREDAKGTEHFKELDFNFVGVLVYTRS